jgi:protein-S-isoprenylcysteine O-methyltransferase Ste14
MVSFFGCNLALANRFCGALSFLPLTESSFSDCFEKCNDCATQFVRRPREGPSFYFARMGGCHKVASCVNAAKAKEGNTPPIPEELAEADRLCSSTGRMLHRRVASEGKRDFFATSTMKAESKTRVNGFLDRGGLWVVAQSMLLTAAAGASIFYEQQFVAFRLQLLLASLLLMFAAWTGLAGVIALGENRTALPAPLPDGELVSTGIYRFVRHPLYLSLILWAISWPLFWSSIVGLACAVFVIVFFDLKARHEEQLLLRHHPEYGEYALRVKRFLPGIY